MRLPDLLSGPLDHGHHFRVTLAGVPRIRLPLPEAVEEHPEATNPLVGSKATEICDWSGRRLLHELILPPHRTQPCGRPH